MDSSQLQDEIRISQPPLNSTTPASADVLIYFLTGNPGLIEYYRRTLTYLSKCLWDDRFGVRYHIVGRSLGGFELNTTSNETSLPLSLQGQIQHVEKSLEDCTRDLRSTVKHPDRPLPVILVGHSVGTYIALTLIARRQQRQRLSHSHGAYNLIAAINLFPTIVDIALSPSGKKVNFFATSTYLAPTLSLVSKVLTTLSPAWALQSLVERITGHAPAAAAVTTAFLRSKTGVLQALHMGRFELLEMTDDRWPESVWDRGLQVGDEAEGDWGIDRPRLYFYWAENDHWIDNGTRDAVIARRAKRNGVEGQKGRPFMEVDGRGTGHDFCIDAESSDFIAGKVAGYVKEIVEDALKEKVLAEAKGEVR